MVRPSDYTLEIEFEAGVWTDVSDSLELTPGVSITVGRSTPYEGVQPSTMSVTVDNSDGRFTPLRQFLNDGTDHPYWPNVLPRRRIRLSWTRTTHTSQRFFGYINGWPPTYLNASGRPVVTITATDRLKQMQKVTLLPPLQHAITLDEPDAFWPLADEVGSRSADEITSSHKTADMQVFFPTVNFSELQFGSNPGGYADGAAAVFKPDSNAGADGQFLFAPLERMKLDWTSWSLEMWFYVGHKSDAPSWFSTTGMTLLSINTGRTDELYVIAVGPSLVFHGIAGRPGPWGGDNTVDLTDAKWHQVVTTFDAAHARIYFDGVLVDSDSTPLDWALTEDMFGLALGAANIGYTTGFTNLFSGGLRDVAIWKRPLTAGEVADHYTAGTGFIGEDVHDRMTRWFETANIPSSEYSVDASDIALNTYPQTGTDITTAMTDTALSEGGGAVFFVDPLTGDMTFRNRRYRDDLTPVLTLDAVGDVAADAWLPSFDESEIVNQVNGQRAAASGVVAIYTVIDQDSIDTYGVTAQDMTSYARSGAEVQHVAEEILSRYSQPRMRLSQLPVDLWTAQTSGIYGDVAVTTIGSRIAVDNLPIGAGFPTDALELFVEGWTETITESGHRIVYNTSSAEPRRALAGTALAAADGMTLTGPRTPASTTILVDTTTSGKLSTAAMPFDVQVGGPGGEIMTVNLQTFFVGTTQTVGVTRGQHGTAAVDHAAGEPVQLWPLDTAAL